MQEVVANLFSEMITADEATMNRLCGEKPSLMRQVWTWLKDTIGKLTGVNDPQVDTLKKAERLMEKALGEVSKAEKTGEANGSQYSLSDDGESRNIDSLTEADELDLIDRCTNFERSDYIGNRNIYIPLRRNTPSIIADVIGCGTEPILMSAIKLQQAATPEGDVGENGERGHGISGADLIEISKAMEHPQYIVEQDNGRYGIVVGYRGSNGKYALAILEIGNDIKYDKTVGYPSGKYNVIVTEYKKTNQKEVQQYCTRDGNRGSVKVFL